MARREFSAIDPIGRRFSFGPGDDGKAEPVSPPRTLDAVVGASFTQRRFNMTLLVVFAATRAMDSLLYGVTTTDPLTFVLLPIVLGVVAFMAGLFPALRATRVDPLEALRVD